jgi:hypothetical protein
MKESLELRIAALFIVAIASFVGIMIPLHASKWGRRTMMLDVRPRPCSRPCLPPAALIVALTLAVDTLGVCSQMYFVYCARRPLASSSPWASVTP